MTVAGRHKQYDNRCILESELQHLTRYKISDGWRERAWLRGRGCSYHKLDIGTASR